MTAAPAPVTNRSAEHVADDTGAARGGADEDDSRSRLDELGSYIRQQRLSAELSLRHLARLAGVSNPYLSQIERGLRKPSAEILQAIAKAMSISSETLYVKAGILEERDTAHDLEGCIARDPYLTEPQRAALTEMYRSFRQLAAMRGGGEPPVRRGTVRRLVDAVTPGEAARPAATTLPSAALPPTNTPSDAPAVIDPDLSET